MKTRITVLIPLVVGIFAVVSGVLMYALSIYVFSGIIRKEAQNAVTQEITRLQSLLYERLTEADLTAARMNLSITAMSSDVRTLLLADKRHTVLIANRYALENTDARSTPGYDAAMAGRVMSTSVPTLFFTRQDDALLRGYFPVILQLGAQEGASYKRTGAIFIEKTIAPKLRLVRQEARIATAAFAALMLAASILVALALHIRISRRLARLEAAALALAAGDLNASSGITGNDELAGVAKAFDGMVARLRSDIMRREEVEEQLRRNVQELRSATAQLEHSNRELKQYAFIASHDLQEPLRAIISYTQLLQNRYAPMLTEKEKQFAKFIIDASKRMKQLVNDLLAYSAVDSERLAPAAADLNEILGHVRENLRDLIERANAELVVEPLPVVRCHPARIATVFQNLISNAIKYRGAEPPRVSVGAVREAGHWRFHVRDNGIGIDPQFFERIFVIFQRLHGREDYDGGTGIGLAICKKLVERQGGRISVESTPGKGSTFYFTLPDTMEEPGGNDKETGMP